MTATPSTTSMTAFSIHAAASCARHALTFVALRSNVAPIPALAPRNSVSKGLSTERRLSGSASSMLGLAPSSLSTTLRAPKTVPKFSRIRKILPLCHPSSQVGKTFTPLEASCSISPQRLPYGFKPAIYRREIVQYEPSPAAARGC